jgi:hypothetical protein
MLPQEKTQIPARDDAGAGKTIMAGLCIRGDCATPVRVFDRAARRFD